MGSSVFHRYVDVDVCSASTIEHLKNTLRDGEVMVFFYCNFRNELSRSSTQLMRSLLSQLFCHIDDHGIDPGDLPNKILEGKSKGTLSLNNLNKLCDLVSDAASCFLWNPVIVIDALDECSDIEALLDALITLNLGDVRLLVTSRPDPIITRHFSRLPSLSFESVTKELAVDISLHIGRVFESHKQLRSADAEMRREIQSGLNGKAEGR